MSSCIDVGKVVTSPRSRARIRTGERIANARFGAQIFAFVKYLDCLLGINKGIFVYIFAVAF